jgi:electron transfer flavoprotein alpha subunit
MTVLLVAEQRDGALNDVTARALTAAKQMGEAVHVLILGQGAGEAAKAAARLEGVGKVHVAEGGTLDHGLAEPAAALLVKLADHHKTIVAPATAATKNIMPRAAALLDVMQVSEITRVVSSDTFERPIYAGNAIQTVQSADPVKIITVRTAAFAVTPAGSAEAPIEALDTGAIDTGAIDSTVSRFKGEELATSDRPELTSAKVIVSGGRAMGKAENFKTYLEPIADKLGAAMGASRAAVDAGLAPNDWQVGQTGKVVAPDLYIAVGISGAIQHLAGMKDSKVIVAINKDEEAPIFQVADYGLVGDLFTILPELEKELAKG